MPSNSPLRLEGQGVALEVDGLLDLALLPSNRLDSARNRRQPFRRWVLKAARMVPTLLR